MSISEDEGVPLDWTGSGRHRTICIVRVLLFPLSPASSCLILMVAILVAPFVMQVGQQTWEAHAYIIVQQFLPKLPVPLEKAEVR